MATQPRTHSYEAHTGPDLEARNMLALLKAGESAESVRRTIGNDSPYRSAVLLAFDMGVARLSKNRKRLNLYVKRRDISPYLRNVIVRQLRAGRPVGDVERAFGIGYLTLLKLRHEKDDFERARRRKKLSPANILEGTEALRAGQSWATVARRMGVTVQTLATDLRYRKRDDRRKLSPAETEQAIQHLKNGSTWARVAAGLGMKRSTLQAKLPFLKRGARQERMAAE